MLCCCEFGVSHETSVQNSCTDFTAGQLGNWCVPLLTLMKLPVRFPEQTLRKSCYCPCTAGLQLCPEAFLTYIHALVFISSSHVAIRSLLWGRLLWSTTCFLLVGQTGSSSAPRFRFAERRAILGHKQETSTVWYERAAGSGSVWEDVSQCDASSLLQYYNGTNVYK